VIVEVPEVVVRVVEKVDVTGLPTMAQSPVAVVPTGMLRELKNVHWPDSSGMRGSLFTGDGAAKL
jgi:hypothetical protein